MVSVIINCLSFEIRVLPTTDSSCFLQGIALKNCVFFVNLTESYLFKL